MAGAAGALLIGRDTSNLEVVRGSFLRGAAASGSTPGPSKREQNGRIRTKEDPSGMNFVGWNFVVMRFGKIRRVNRYLSTRSSHLSRDHGTIPHRQGRAFFLVLSARGLRV